MIASRSFLPSPALAAVGFVIAFVIAPGAARAQTTPATAPTVPPPSLAAAPAKPPETAVAGIPLRLALELEAVNGVITGSFHNQLAGVRLDGRFSEHLSLGGYVGVADLKGKDGRAHAALTLASLEYMAGGPASTVRYPLRFATGWLAANGPVARLSGGIAIAVGQRVDLVAQLGSAVWVTNNQNLLSLDGSFEVAFRL